MIGEKNIRIGCLCKRCLRTAKFSLAASRMSASFNYFIILFGFDGVFTFAFWIREKSYNEINILPLGTLLLNQKPFHLIAVRFKYIALKGAIGVIASDTDTGHPRQNVMGTAGVEQFEEIQHLCVCVWLCVFSSQSLTGSGCCLSWESWPCWATSPSGPSSPRRRSRRTAWSTWRSRRRTPKWSTRSILRTWIEQTSATAAVGAPKR